MGSISKNKIIWIIVILITSISSCSRTNSANSSTVPSIDAVYFFYDEDSNTLITSGQQGRTTSYIRFIKGNQTIKEFVFKGEILKLKVKDSKLIGLNLIENRELTTFSISYLDEYIFEIEDSYSFPFIRGNKYDLYLEKNQQIIICEAVAKNASQTLCFHKPQNDTLTIQKEYKSPFILSFEVIDFEHQYYLEYDNNLKSILLNDNDGKNIWNSKFEGKITPDIDYIRLKKYKDIYYVIISTEDGANIWIYDEIKDIEKNYTLGYQVGDVGFCNKEIFVTSIEEIEEKNDNSDANWLKVIYRMKSIDSPPLPCSSRGQNKTTRPL